MKDVRVERLVKRFGQATAVDGITFHVPRGKFVTLLGPSGCGKTTTLNIIAGFENPDEGEVFVADRLISSGAGGIILPPHKRNVGMVFQSYGLWPHFTVAENVGFGLKMRSVPRVDAQRKVKDALRLVRLDGLENRYPSQLSGGQQQRVAFARAVVYEPDVLLLDEPLSNLDAALREEMRLELKELQHQTGITTLFVTHDQIEAIVMSDLIVILNNGRVEQIGTPREVYENPANQFVAGFLGVSNFLEGEIVESSGVEEAASVRVGQHILQCRATSRSKGETVLVSVRPEDWEVSKDKPVEGAINSMSSRVEKIVYMGRTMEVWARVAGSLIRIQGVHLPSVEVGNTLYLRARPEDIILIKQDREH